MEFVRELADVDTTLDDKPKIPVVISNCGELNEAMAFVRHDPFGKKAVEKME